MRMKKLKLIKNNSNNELCEKCIYADSTQQVIGIHWFIDSLAKNWPGYISRQNYLDDVAHIKENLDQCVSCMQAQQAGFIPKLEKL